MTNKTFNKVKRIVACISAAIVFIVGIRDDEDNNFTWPKEMFLEKRLRDVLEDNVDEKYYLSEKLISWITSHREKRESKNNFPMDENGISGCVTARYFKTGAEDPYIKVKSATKQGFEIAQIGEDSINLEHPNSQTRRGRVGEKVAQTLTTSCNQGVAERIHGWHENENVIAAHRSDEKRSTVSEHVYHKENGVCTTIQTAHVPKAIIGIGVHPNSKKLEFDGFKDRHCPTLLATDYKAPKCIQYSDYRIRKLTPRECFRLMDFHDTFSWPVSDSQAYKQAGNSICVGVLAGIINKLNI